MNKLLISLVFSMAAFLLFGSERKLAFALGEGELTNELPEADNGDEDSYDGGITDLFGRNNVLEDGVGNLVPPKRGNCAGSRSESACRNCCQVTGKAYKFSLSPGVKSIHWYVCTCFARSPQ